MLGDKINDKLENIDWYLDMIYLDSIKQLRGSASVRNEYIFTDEVSVKDKLWDLDELIKWGEDKEFYKDCQMLLDMKKEIIING
tara:strand:- start:179 stop:430 length:252 start_codon:yes stop_codon:yes gene_type:complete